MPSNGNWGPNPVQYPPQPTPNGNLGGYTMPPIPVSGTGPNQNPKSPPNPGQFGTHPYGPPPGSPGGRPQGAGGASGVSPNSPNGGPRYLGPPNQTGWGGGYRPMPSPGSGWPGAQSKQPPLQTIQPGGGPTRFNPQGGKASPMIGPNGQPVWIWNGKAYPYDPTAGGMSNPGIEDGNPFAPPWDPGQAY